jgi:hypothetical protein
LLGGRNLRWGIALAALTALLLPASSAGAATFSFSNNVQINPQLIFGPAMPYPTTIQVSGITDVTDVNATVRSFSANEPADFDVMLAGPQDQASVLMSDVPAGQPGCNTPVSGLDLVFNDEAPGPIPAGAVLTSGGFQPTDNDANTPGCGATNSVRPDNYGPTAPDEPSNAPLSVFDGTNPNGDWRLFVVNDLDGGTGSIAGWTLQITSSANFDLGKVKKNKRKGTASISVAVPGPGTLTLGGKGVKAQRPRRGERITAARTVTEAGTVTLPVKAKGKKKKKLKSTGKTKLSVDVVFTPAGGAPDTETQPVKLVKK